MQIIEEFPGENRIEIDAEALAGIDGAVEVKGRNNVLILGTPAHSAGFYALLTGDCHLEIGKGNWFNKQEVYIAAPGRVTIGEGCSWSGPVVVTVHEPSNIDIGAHCLIAGSARISASHVHKIYDRATGERINKPRDVKVGDRVWLGANTSIFPGADIGSGCVVGIGAYVSKVFPDNCLIVGAPARVVRENIVWEP